MSIHNKVRDGICLAVAYCATTYVQQYQGPMQGLFHGYGSDVITPFSFYFSHQLLDSPLTQNKRYSAGFIFLGCSLFELAQGFGLYRSTFDPKDFFAYAVGAGLALMIDNVTSKKVQSTLEQRVKEK